MSRLSRVTVARGKVPILSLLSHIRSFVDVVLSLGLGGGWFAGVARGAGLIQLMIDQMRRQSQLRRAARHLIGEP